MQSLRLWILLLTALTARCASIFAASISPEDAAAEKFVQEANTSEYLSATKFSDELLSLVNSDKDDEYLFRNALKELIEQHNQAKEFDISIIQNETTKAALREIRWLPDTYILGEQEFFNRFLPAAHNLTNTPFDKDIEPFLNGSKKANYSDDELLSYVPEVVDIIRTTHNAKELKHYWLSWRAKNAANIEFHLEHMIDDLKKAAKLLDMPILDFWYRNLYGKNISADMLAVIKQLQPSYKQIHAFIRHELQLRYGSELDANAPIPEQYIELVLWQMYTADSILEAYAPIADLPRYDAAVKQKYTAKALLEEANRFMSSMGFESFDQQYMETHMREEKSQAAHCENELHDFVSQPALIYCDTVSFIKYIEMHEIVLRAFYAREGSNLPVYFLGTYNMDEALAKAVMLSIVQPGHLAKLGLTKNTDYKMQRLLHNVVFTYLVLLRQFTLNQVMEDVLTDKIKFSEMNTQYWKIMDEFFGIEPPVNRAGFAYFDFPNTFYDDIEENKQAMNFFANVMGYQLYEALCQKTGQAEDLSNCQFEGNQEIGAAMKSIMHLGLDTPYEQIVGKILTKDTKLSASSLLDYFADALGYIEAKNKENGVEIGWQPSKKEF